MSGVALALVAFGLIAVNGLFVAVEFSLLASRRSRIEEWVDEGRFGSVSALAAMRAVNVQLAASQLGITVCSLLLGWLIEPVVGGGFETLLDGVSVTGRAADVLSVVLALVIVALFHMVLGEMIPKSVALAAPERTAVVLVPAHRGFVVIVRPIVRVLYRLGYWGTKAIGVEPADELISAHTPAELAVMVEESRAGGELEAGEHELLAGALGFLGVRTFDVMAPRDEVVIVPATATVSEAEDLMRRSGHSRVLVAGDGDSIKGFLHAKDLLKLPDSARDGLLPGGLVRRALQVGPDDRLPDLLPLMRRDRRHVAVVVDDDQRVVGLVTLEDILEAIIGDIRDESDRGAE